MGAVFRILICVHFFVCSAQLVHGQVEQENIPYQNTIQINIAGTFANTVGIIYSRHVQSGNNLMFEIGYTFPRSPAISNKIRNLRREEVTGFFIKVGPEFCHYQNERKMHSFIITTFYGKGSIEQDIIITHLLGEFRQERKNIYTTYGIGLGFNQTFFNIGDRFFSEGTIELSLANTSTTAQLPLKEYPGVGGVTGFGLGFRMLGKFGYRF